MPIFYYSRKSDGKIESIFAEMPARKSQVDVIPSRAEQDKGESSSLSASKSNYEQLPHHLKSCLDYCSIFSKKFSIEKQKLVRLLLAQGLIPEKQGQIMEDVAANIIKELIGLEMLEEDQKFNSKVHVSEFHQESCLVEVDEQDFVANAANLPIHAVIEDDGKTLPLDFKNFRIRSLFATAIEHDQIQYIGAFSEAYLQTVCGLQFLLILELLGTVEYLPDEVGDLVHLRYLGLCSEIKKIPCTIGNLQKLQTLDISCGENLCKLPVEILNIRQLRHLLLKDYLEFDGGIRVPRGIGTLIHLQSFTAIFSGASFASELSLLTKLRSLDIRNVSEDHADELFAVITNLENLVSLSISAEQARRGSFLPEMEQFSPPPHLKELHLRGGLFELPNWLASIENLTNLGLYHSNLLENPSSVLQFLSKLKHLTLRNAYKTKLIGKEFCKEGGFQKLETLTICSEDLVEWTEIVNGAFPCLRTLQFFNCLNLKFLPEGLENISSIRELRLWPSHGDLARRLGGEENYKIKHIPNFQTCPVPWLVFSPC
ncbi:probable disease resistance RPP8-like protein 2 [Hevea brasiliensis]|uniref:probable disease resistance RPP8-like protein 2 n=1 Tax=Hevea brasiliensis TaxID=3981 RepID=UPI0025FEE56C|nr:probable disease resistance RPP8-like protein 2 [Hevea brasiliensis]